MAEISKTKLEAEEIFHLCGNLQDKINYARAKAAHYANIPDIACAFNVIAIQLETLKECVSQERWEFKKGGQDQRLGWWRK